MSTDLGTLLGRAADDLVPEPFPLEERLDDVRRRVRRRRAVRRVQAGAGALVGVTALGSLAALLAPELGPGPAGPAAVCGEPIGAVLPEAGPVDGFATLQTADGTSVTLRTQLENPTGDDVTTTGDVTLLVSLHGTGHVVGHAVAPAQPTTVAAGTSGDLVTTVPLAACGFAGAAAGDPLPDGTYDLTLTGTAVTDTGEQVPWTAATAGIRVTDGAIGDLAVPDPGPTADGTFAPVCGAMVPAVPESDLWATLAAPAASFSPAEPDAPYDGGMPLDVTLGTTAPEPVAGELSPEVVVVLTDRDGVVVTWWRASEHGRPLDLGPAVELPAEGSQAFPGFAWFPVVDDCAGGAPVADGDYRLLTWLSVTVQDGEGGVEHRPVLTAPLDVTVGAGVMTQL